MISDADRLLAQGVWVTFESKPTRVRFSMFSLLFLEKEYGGLDVFYAKLTEHDFGTARVETITTGMVAGLLAAKPDKQNLEDFRRRVTAALEPKEMLTYLEALVIALNEAMPAFEVRATPKAKGSRGNSRGRSSTSSRPSAAAARNASSGA